MKIASSGFMMNVIYDYGIRRAVFIGHASDMEILH